MNLSEKQKKTIAAVGAVVAATALVLVLVFVYVQSLGSSKTDGDVTDTKMPNVTLHYNLVYLSNLANIDYKSFVTATDADTVTESLVSFVKVADLSYMDETKEAEYTARLTSDAKAELDRESVEATEEGIYRAIYTATDATGNVNAVELIVVYDTTAPTITGTDKIDEEIAVENVNDTWEKDFSENLEATDMVDGNIARSKADVQMTLTDKENHVYTVKVTYADRAGNKAVAEYSFKLVAKGGSGGENNTDTGAEKPDEKPDTEPEKPSYTYKDMEKTMYATKRVNVRDLPDSSGKKLGSLSAGDEVKVTGQCNETKWYRFEYKGKVGYASKDYFSETKPQTPTEKPSGGDSDLPPGYSWSDKDGDGGVDLPEQVQMGDMLVDIPPFTDPEYALFKKQLSEAGLHKVMYYPKKDVYYCLFKKGENYDEFLEKWAMEQSKVITSYGIGSWGTLNGEEIEYCLISKDNLVDYVPPIPPELLP